MLFVHQGYISEGERFFARFWPSARGVADYETRLYAAFGLGRGSLRQVFGVRVLLRALAVAARGYFMGRPRGDIWLMPGVFLLRGDTVAWQHRYRHIADAPRSASIPRIPRRRE